MVELNRGYLSALSFAVFTIALSIWYGSALIAVFLLPISGAFAYRGFVLQQFGRSRALGTLPKEDEIKTLRRLGSLSLASTVALLSLLISTVVLLDQFAQLTPPIDASKVFPSDATTALEALAVLSFGA